MEYLKVLENLNPTIYEQLKQSLEIGKWTNGELLTERQKEIVMQALIGWGEIHLPAEQRIGYIDKGKKEKSRDDGASSDLDSSANIISMS
ncbi:MAG: DUF1315 family protein [Halieaceae bacterium]|nr:DUF1315 family protein [Halieaceae bacterium]